MSTEISRIARLRVTAAFLRKMAYEGTSFIDDLACTKGYRYDATTWSRVVEATKMIRRAERCLEASRDLALRALAPEGTSRPPIPRGKVKLMNVTSLKRSQAAYAECVDRQRPIVSGLAGNRYAALGEATP